MNTVAGAGDEDVGSFIVVLMQRGDVSRYSRNLSGHLNCSNG